MTKRVPPKEFRFSSTHQPLRPRGGKNGWRHLDVQATIKDTGKIATSIRHQLTRAAHRAFSDIENLAEGGDASAAAQLALEVLTPEVRALLRDAEAAAGLSTPNPEDHTPAMTEMDVRATAMAALELLRQAAAPVGEVIDVTPEEVKKDG